MYTCWVILPTTRTRLGLDSFQKAYNFYDKLGESHISELIKICEACQATSFIIKHRKPKGLHYVQLEATFNHLSEQCTFYIKYGEWLHSLEKKKEPEKFKKSVLA